VGAPGLAGFETRVKASVLLACRSDKLQLEHAPVINSDQSWFSDDTGNGLSPHPAASHDGQQVPPRGLKSLVGMTHY